MKTFVVKKHDIKRKWYHLDANNISLGRTATMASTILRGKHKREYTPNIEMGDFVVITNAAKIKLTGKKLEQKQYIRHSGYPGGIKIETLNNLLKVSPSEPIIRAIKGMIPNNHFKDIQMRRLKVYPSEKHKHSQNLIRINLEKNN